MSWHLYRVAVLGGSVERLDGGPALRRVNEDVERTVDQELSVYRYARQAGFGKLNELSDYAHGFALIDLSRLNISSNHYRKMVNRGARTRSDVQRRTNDGNSAHREPRGRCDRVRRPRDRVDVPIGISAVDVPAGTGSRR